MTNENFVTAELFVMVDENGDWVCSNDRDTLHEQWEGDIGDIPIISRVLAIRLNVEKPTQTCLSAEVPNRAVEASMVVTP